MIYTICACSAVQVKAYLERQWGRILANRVSIQDFVFAKEVRLGTYSPKASVVPPAAIVAAKAMAQDPRAEPRFAERIPYVVVHGEPGTIRLQQGIMLRQCFKTLHNTAALGGMPGFFLVSAPLHVQPAQCQCATRNAFSCPPVLLQADKPRMTRSPSCMHLTPLCPGSPAVCLTSCLLKILYSLTFMHICLQGLAWLTWWWSPAHW